MSLQQQGWACSYVPGSRQKVTEINDGAMANIAENRFSTRESYHQVHLGQARIHLPRRCLQGPQNVENLACALGAGQVRTGARTRGGRKEGKHGDGPNSLVAHANSRA